MTVDDINKKGDRSEIAIHISKYSIALPSIICKLVVGAVAFQKITPQCCRNAADAKGHCLSALR
jgi:hypothetical protein